MLDMVLMDQGSHSPKTYDMDTNPLQLLYTRRRVVETKNVTGKTAGGCEALACAAPLTFATQKQP